MIFIVMLGVFIVTTVMVWFVQQWSGYGFARYHRAFTMQARKDLGDMFLFFDPGQVWLASIFLCGGVALIVYVLTYSAAMAGLSLTTLFVPPYILSRARQRRMRQLEHQLPDLLLMLAGSLRAGSGLQSALRHGADHVEEPLSQELQLMAREQRMGVSFEQALDNLHHRIPTESVSLIVSAFNIAAQSGGSLAETLERISATLRTRLHLLGRIRALTSQGRMQAWVMVSLPPALAAVLHWLDPDAMSALWSTASGWVVIILIIVLEVTGLFFIRRIVQIDV